jgi:FixJ family two-component response regulator
MSTSLPLIHVVDDDESLRTALLRLLDAAGFEARGYVRIPAPFGH